MMCLYIFFSLITYCFGVVFKQVFGVKFDELAAKAVVGLVVSALPTAAMFIYQQITHDDHDQGNESQMSCTFDAKISESIESFKCLLDD